VASKYELFAAARAASAEYVRLQVELEASAAAHRKLASLRDEAGKASANACGRLMASLQYAEVFRADGVLWRVADLCGERYSVVREVAEAVLEPAGEGED
jgi:hypothetical protein